VSNFQQETAVEVDQLSPNSY